MAGDGKTTLTGSARLAKSTVKMNVIFSKVLKKTSLIANPSKYQIIYSNISSAACLCGKTHLFTKNTTKKRAKKEVAAFSKVFRDNTAKKKYALVFKTVILASVLSYVNSICDRYGNCIEAKLFLSTVRSLEPERGNHLELGEPFLVFFGQYVI